MTREELSKLTAELTANAVTKFKEMLAAQPVDTATFMSFSELESVYKLLDTKKLRTDKILDKYYEVLNNPKDEQYWGLIINERVNGKTYSEWREAAMMLELQLLHLEKHIDRKLQTICWSNLSYTN